MNEDWNLRCPEALSEIQRATEAAGELLELGTGTGMGASWLLSGMDASSTLDTVDHDESVVSIARRFLGHDSRVRFHVSDGAEFLATLAGRQFDLIFADTWPGKFNHLEDTLSLLRPGGIYVGDDLLPQPSRPEGHAPKIPQFLHALEQRPDFHITRLSWSTGLVLATKRSI